MKLKAKVTKVLYYKNGWGIFGCRPLDVYESAVEMNSYGSFTIKGSSFELIEGNDYTIEISDTIERSPKGDSYLIEKIHMPKNTSSQAQYNFLKTITTGNQFTNIIKAFPLSNKLKIIDAIKNDEIDLSQVKGIGQKNIIAIKKRIEDKEEFIHVYNRLSPLGVSETMVNKIISHFGSTQTVLAKVNESMYNLCVVKGMGFTTVDEYALKDGEKEDSFKRIEACVNYLVYELSKEGHSWISLEEVKKKAVKLLSINEHHLDVFLGSLDLMEDDTILRNVHDGQITNKFFYSTEKELYTHLKRLDNSYKINVSKNSIDDGVKLAEEKLNVEFTDEQLQAISESFNHGVYSITAPAGAGKSLLMKAITEICDSLKLEYQAVALSGRAAQLLSLKGIKASTIHRLLGYEGEGFIYNNSNKLTHDVIILEEASMANASLWNSITCAMKDGSKLIIIGDSGQLSAIGNGDVLRDILHNPKFNGIELKTIHRQARDSGIIEIAGQIRNGQNVTGYNWELSNTYGVNEDLFIFTYNNKDTLYQTARSIVHKQISKLDESTVMDFQILVSNKSKGEFSTVKINKFCQDLYIKGNGKFLKNHTHDFFIGDKVIINGNKYESHLYKTINEYESTKYNLLEENGVSGEIVSLYNGTIGIVKHIDDDKDFKSLLVEFEGFDGYILIDDKSMSDLDLSYSISIHKSQGQTLKNVLVLLDFGAFNLLSRQLIYTAITRASNKCVMLAENGALYKAIETDASGLRKTFVGQFIQMDNK